MNGRHTTQNFLYTNQSKNPYGFDKAKRKSKFRQFSFFFFSPVHSILPFTEHYFPTKFGSLCLLLYRQQYTHHPNMYFVFFFCLFHSMLCVWLFLCLFNRYHHQETCTHKEIERNTMYLQVLYFFSSPFKILLSFRTDRNIKYQ